MDWEVYDVNTGETLHSFDSELKARWCAIDLNKPHLDKLYKVRKAVSYYSDEYHSYF